MSKPLILTEYPDAATEKLWDEFLAEASFPTHYVTPNVFVDPYIRGGVRFAVLCLNDGRVDAVLTGVDSGKTIVWGLQSVRKRRFGEVAIFRPQRLLCWRGLRSREAAIFK